METLFQALRATRTARQEQLEAYLRIPSISSDPQHAPDMARCAEFTAELLRQAGLEQVTVHPTPGHPLVVGRWQKAPHRPTVLIYGHYDVQPVDPLDLWVQEPFTPRYHNERIFARGATDDKGQLLMHIQAVAAILRATGALPVNVIFLLEGEEEIGSPHLPAFIAAHRAELAADLALVSDSFMWAENRPAITTLLRGLVELEVVLTGPNQDLHSGSFGGVIANPLEMLARLLASIKDDAGTIQIPGFYAAVREPKAALRAQWAALPFDETAYLHRLGLTQGWGEAGYTLLERLWLRPTFEINGLWGGYTGPGGKTVLPSQAHAKLSLRLVPDQDPDVMAELVKNYLLANTPPQVTIEVSRAPGGGCAVVVPQEWSALQAARRALQESFQQEPLLIGEGCSIPIVADFEKMLGLHTLLIGFGLPDAQVHAPNESLHWPTFHTGTESLVRLLHYLAEDR
ncbi:MAG: dipeptidase [Magnetococcales bacterium]|nr:dipeptidase [Magnetococcales bacterium]